MPYFDTNLFKYFLNYGFPILLYLYAVYLKRKKKAFDSFLMSVVSILLAVFFYRSIPWRTIEHTYSVYPIFILVFAILNLFFIFKNYEQVQFMNLKLNLFEKISYSFSLVIFLPLAVLSILSTPGEVIDKYELEYPMKGTNFIIFSGGTTPIVNHHSLNTFQHYALDIIQECDNGKVKDDIKNFCIWDSRLYSVCDGKITKSEDRYIDNTLGTRDFKNPKGNFLVVKCNNGLSVLYAHLRKNSIQVKSEEIVHAGSFIGNVGNSGNSTEPHLHIQANDEINDSVVLNFKGRSFIRNDIFNN